MCFLSHLIFLSYYILKSRFLLYLYYYFANFALRKFIELGHNITTTYIVLYITILCFKRTHLQEPMLGNGSQPTVLDPSSGLLGPAHGGSQCACFQLLIHLFDQIGSLRKV